MNENQEKTEPNYQGFVEHVEEITEAGLPVDKSDLTRLAEQYGTPIPSSNSELNFGEVHSVKKTPIFINNQKDDSNLDLFDGKDLNYYLELTKNFKSDMPEPVIKQVGKFFVVDEGALELTGTKARFGDFLISQIPNDELVYCQPRTGFAGISLCYLAKKYGKKVTLFMPASKEASKHQLLCIELGADAKFRRIAAMPVLQGIARKYAEERGAFYIPFGLKHELVAAGGVRAVHNFFKDKEHPKEMWTVASTGVLTRALQIALPNTKFYAVAVARNMQPGELGRAEFISYHKPFTAKADKVPTEFETVDTYDAKGFEYMENLASEGAYFWNVAADAGPKNLKSEDVDSYRDWGQIKD